MPEGYFRAREQLLGTAEGLQRLASLPPRRASGGATSAARGTASTGGAIRRVAGDFRAPRARGRAVDRIESGAAVILEAPPAPPVLPVQCAPSSVVVHRLPVISPSGKAILSRATEISSRFRPTLSKLRRELWE